MYARQKNVLNQFNILNNICSSLNAVKAYLQNTLKRDLIHEKISPLRKDDKPLCALQ